VVRIKKQIANYQEQSRQIPSSHKVRGLCFVFVFLGIFTLVSRNTVSAQDTVSSALKPVPAIPLKTHSPRKATILAMVLPGSGQVYNHKYWKVPIVYAGFGAMIYVVNKNTRYYRELKDAYDYVSVTMKTIYPPSPVNIFPYPAPPNDWAKKGYTEDQLKQGVEVYRRNLELSYIFTGVWYILTVVDAVVDAHFYSYDINDDLTLQVKPWIPSTATNTAPGFSGGINLSLRF